MALQKQNCSSIILYDNKKQVLLQKKTWDFRPAPGKWLFFGGRMEQSEQPLQTIKREIIEELNIKIEPTFFEAVDYIAALDNREGLEYIHHAKLPCELSKLIINEGAGIALFAQEEIDNLPMMEHQYNSLQRFYEWLKI